MLTTHSALQNWSTNRPHLSGAAQFLSSLYPGLHRIRIKESDYFNSVRIRITVKVKTAQGKALIVGRIQASHLDTAISRIIRRIDSQPELRKLALS